MSTIAQNIWHYAINLRIVCVCVCVCVCVFWVGVMPLSLCIIQNKLFSSLPAEYSSSVDLNGFLTLTSCEQIIALFLHILTILHVDKYKNHFIKMKNQVGMAVQKVYQQE